MPPLCPAEDPRHPVRGEISVASGVQAEGRGCQGSGGVLWPPLTHEECCESRGKHPPPAPHRAGERLEAASPAP